MLENILNINTIGGFLALLTPAYLTAYLVLSILRCECSTLRLLAFSFLYAVFSIIRERLKNPTTLLDLIVFTILILILRRDYTIVDFFKTSFTFLVVGILSLGVRLLIKEILDPNSTLESIFFSLSIVFTAFFVKIINRLSTPKRLTKRVYKVEVMDGEKRYLTKGYLDSGNMLYDRGEPVVVISKRIASKLSLTPDRSVSLATASGIGVLRGGKCMIKIILDKKTHKVLPIVYAVSDKIIGREYEVILHKDMEFI